MLCCSKPGRAWIFWIHSSHHSYSPLVATISDSESWIIFNWVWSIEICHFVLSFLQNVHLLFHSSIHSCYSSRKKATYRLLATLQLQFCHLALAETHSSADWKVHAQNGVAAFWPGTIWPGPTAPLFTAPGSCLFSTDGSAHPCHQLSFVFYTLTAWNTQNLIFLSLIWYIQGV